MQSSGFGSLPIFSLLLTILSSRPVFESSSFQSHIPWPRCLPTDMLSGGSTVADDC